MQGERNCSQGSLYRADLYLCRKISGQRSDRILFHGFLFLKETAHEANCKIQIVALINHDFSADSEEETERLIRNRKIESHRKQIEALQNCEDDDMAIIISQIAYHEKRLRIWKRRKIYENYQSGQNLSIFPYENYGFMIDGSNIKAIGIPDVIASYPCRKAAEFAMEDFQSRQSLPFHHFVKQDHFCKKEYCDIYKECPKNQFTKYDVILLERPGAEGLRIKMLSALRNSWIRTKHITL